jgi:uncharacterized protein YbjT (DUF2867 family)
MRVLLTGASGAVGAALAQPLRDAGHEVRAYARTPSRVRVEVDEVVQGDAVAGTGLDQAFDGVDVAFYLIHSMETEAGGAFADSERRAAEHVAAAAARAGCRRIVYLGGPVPPGERVSAHLGSRLAVEEVLLREVPEAVALRASIVISAASRSFRFLVRLVERTPALPLPPWRHNRTRPIDGRDVTAYLLAAATSDRVDGPLSLDIAGPDEVTFGQLVERIRDHLGIVRPPVPLPVSLTPVAAQVAAAIAGEDPGLIEPLMGSLDSDLLPRDERAQELFPIRLHGFDRAVERALRDWEAVEELAAR